MPKLSEAVKFWSEKLGLDQGAKTKKKRMKLRDAKKAQRQTKYATGKKVGSKAVRTQRKKRRQLKEAYGK